MVKNKRREPRGPDSRGSLAEGPASHSVLHLLLGRRADDVVPVLDPCVNRPGGRPTWPFRSRTLTAEERHGETLRCLEQPPARHSQPSFGPSTGQSSSFDQRMAASAWPNASLVSALAVGVPTPRLSVWVLSTPATGGLLIDDDLMACAWTLGLVPIACRARVLARPPRFHTTQAVQHQSSSRYQRPSS